MKAGRKPKYGEKTTTIAFRVPLSLVDKVKAYVRQELKKVVCTPS